MLLAKAWATGDNILPQDFFHVFVYVKLLNMPKNKKTPNTWIAAFFWLIKNEIEGCDVILGGPYAWQRNSWPAASSLSMAYNVSPDLSIWQCWQDFQHYGLYLRTSGACAMMSLVSVADIFTATILWTKTYGACAFMKGCAWTQRCRVWSQLNAVIDLYCFCETCHDTLFSSCWRVRHSLLFQFSGR